ncbi:hypothetical protein GCM10020221_10080 [Streptomyces thioluteus]|uniref:Uncharacterized protein n=1 Tax=Streptomyces thioluteus TaxID=66431 RepID=A0ABN3WK77_STRTU
MPRQRLAGFPDGPHGCLVFPGLGMRPCHTVKVESTCPWWCSGGVLQGRASHVEPFPYVPRVRPLVGQRAQQVARQRRVFRRVCCRQAEAVDPFGFRVLSGITRDPSGDLRQLPDGLQQ